MCLTPLPFHIKPNNNSQMDSAGAAILIITFNLANSGLWGLFLKDATQLLPQLVERPCGFE
jgi:hypothetical protein